MRFISRSVLLLLVCLGLLAGCGVPTPPPELPTATPGSENPESPLYTALTPVRPTPQQEFVPLDVPAGHIYFARDTGLWRVEPDGSGERQLANLPLTNAPRPSPDGSMVAFTSGKEVYVVASEGGTPRKLASAQLAQPQRLGWSPDGSLLGYLSLDLAIAGNTDAWAVPATGGEPSLIATLTRGASGLGPAYEPGVQWSPDRHWVAVAGVNNPFLVLRWPLSAGNLNDRREVPGGEPDWSPDSQAIIYSETLNGALVVFMVRDSGATPFRNETQLVGTRLGEYAQGPGPLWSPASPGGDSDVIAYRSKAASGEPRVSLRRRGGRELEPLPGNTNNPSWSPQGDKLVVETGHVKEDALGLRWVPDGLAIASISMDGPHTVTPLVKDGRWPVWGK
jgi:Tol biopolymer transport system component